MYCRSRQPFRGSIAALLLAAALLSGCGSTAATESEPPPPPTATPTVTVSFSVDVTPVATSRPVPPNRHLVPRSFVPPKTTSPWLILSPHSGPPVSHIITVRAGNLPARTPIVISWAPNSAASPLTSEGMTGPRGNLSTPFSVPAAQPGSYRVSIDVRGTRYATALYRIVSAATIRVRVAPALTGDLVEIRGRHFLPRGGLLLVAYPLGSARRPTVLGSVRADAGGKFNFRRTTRQLLPGEYELRAWSTGLLASESAESFFQVVL